VQRKLVAPARCSPNWADVGIRGAGEELTDVAHLADEAELPEHEWEPIGRQRLRPVADLEVQVRPTGGARVAHAGEDLSSARPLADLHAHAAGLEVAVGREPAAAAA
jgi:hypothetical protein